MRSPFLPVVTFPASLRSDMLTRALRAGTYSLPKQADRSLNGIIEFLIHRIVRGEPSPYAVEPAETDEERYSDDEDLYGLGGSMTQDSATMKALRRCVVVVSLLLSYSASPQC